MRSLDRYIFRWMGCLLACVALMACTKEIAGEREDPGEEERPGQVEELEAVTIRIGAAETAETKAMHGDENAVEGEFIHTLHLFIVDESSTIEKHIVVTPESTDLDDTQKEQAESGNLPQYTTTVDLMPGKKTMYAFANMKNAMTATDNQNMETYLSGLHEGEEWKDIQSTVIQNPAEKVDIASAKYIPMSVRQEVDLTTDGQRVTLSLVRMVPASPAFPSVSILMATIMLVLASPAMRTISFLVLFTAMGGVSKSLSSIYINLSSQVPPPFLSFTILDARYTSPFVKGSNITVVKTLKIV